MSERAATWLACANSNFALARLISRRSEKPAINLRIHYHKLARRCPHVDRLMLTASSSHRTTTRMTDQSGGEEEVRFARLRRRARRKNVVSLVLSSFLSPFSPAPHVRARRSIYGSENWSVYKLEEPRRSKDIRIPPFFFLLRMIISRNFRPRCFGDNWDSCCPKTNSGPDRFINCTPSLNEYIFKVGSP